MRCNECGYMNEEGTKVCAKCGTKLSATPSSSQPKDPAPRPPAAAKSEGSPTMRGKAASAPAWDQPSEPGPAPAGVSKCPSCGFYPLKEAPAKGRPCPNCGQEGDAQAGTLSQQETTQSPSAAKTAKLGEMNIGETTRVIRLKDEGSGRTVEFSGNNIELNRQSLEAGNNSLSGQTHAVLTIDQGTVSLHDRSSNGATFIQVDGPVVLKNGSRIILGNKVYTIEFD